MATNDYPWSKFFWRDWFSDQKLMMCSLAAQGLWMRLLCVMYDGDRRGYLQHASGKPLTPEQIARIAHCSTEEVSRLLQELVDSGAAYITKEGVVYNKRMIQDEHIRGVRAESGKKGATETNRAVKPGFIYAMKRIDGAVKIGRSKHPVVRLKAVGEAKIIGSWPVENMIAAEAEAHYQFRDKRLDSEWFSLTDDDLVLLAANFQQTSSKYASKPSVSELSDSSLGKNGGSGERKPPPGSEVSWLVRQWLHYFCGTQKTERDHESLDKFFADLLKRASYQQIEDAITKKGRPGTQTTWQFEAEFFPREGTNGTGRPVRSSVGKVRGGGSEYANVFDHGLKNGTDAKADQ